MTPKDRLALAAYMEMLDDTVDLRNDSVGMDGGDPVRLLLAEHDRIADELRRLRISQLRRMHHVINDDGWSGFFDRCMRYACDARRADKSRNQRLEPRIVRFMAVRRKFSLACLAEIERLRALS